MMRSGGMQSWNKARSACQGARNVTISGAADVPGLHDATVLAAFQEQVPDGIRRRDFVPRETFMFRSIDTRALCRAGLAGADIGFLTRQEAAADRGPIPAVALQSEWSSPLGLLPHGDLHRTNKVQVLPGVLKTHVKDSDL
jgi:hypothetical protein